MKLNKSFFNKLYKSLQNPKKTNKYTQIVLMLTKLHNILQSLTKLYKTLSGILQTSTQLFTQLYNTSSTKL
jgi:hypothetical protein